jgi:hypothetical protein
MKKSLIILALVAGCGASDHGGNNSAAPEQANRAKVAAANAPAPPPPADSTGLAGLWQGGSSRQPNQLCIAPKGDSAQFGITVWGPNMASCSGAGIAERSGDALTLTMTGDSACAIQAKAVGNRIVLPSDLPQGCAYYCGANARFAGVAFTRVEGGAAAAGKAKDLAGDPLCG